MQQPANHHLAQLNIGRIRYEVDHQRIVDFTDNLARVNGLAEGTPGFVWRDIDGSGNSTATRPYDPRIAINLTVCESVAALERLDHLTQNGASDHAFDWAFASAQLWKTARCRLSEHAV